MMKVPDAASIAAMRVLSRRLGRRVGGSTGTNFFGLCRLAARMKAEGDDGVAGDADLRCGERYAKTYYSEAWLSEAGLQTAPYEAKLEAFLAGGAFGCVCPEA